MRAVARLEAKRGWAEAVGADLTSLKAGGGGGGTCRRPPPPSTLKGGCSAAIENANKTGAPDFLFWLGGTPFPPPPRVLPQPVHYKVTSATR